MTADARFETTLEECDIVMKGGITSGVVYPSAVLALGDRYRFCNIGGTSVGAIAAAVTAAAEYGRQTCKGTGFAQLEKINAEICQDGFLLPLFTPRPAARGLFRVFLAAFRRRGMLPVLAAAVRHAPWTAAPLLAWWTTLAGAGWVMGPRWWLVPALLGAWGLVLLVIAAALSRRSPPAVLSFFIPVAWPVLIALPSVGLEAWRHLSGPGFGLVAGGEERGLCDWLHRHIQAAAGLDEDRPLTFGMLAQDLGADGEPLGIELMMTTTNLSIAQPLRLPRDLCGYAFDPADLRDALPACVLAWLESHGTPDGDGLVRLPPADDVPVLLAVRLSLSFPGLFTAVRLYAASPQPGTLSGRPVAHWFSDGGISSNFPVHLFDTWLPGRPTFALSFAPFPVDERGNRLDDSEVGLPPAPNECRLPRWVPIDSLQGFASQILDTMQNWRDTTQAELPGFRERVYEARLDKRAGEGGLNLQMKACTVKRLQQRGILVGDEIVRTFDMDQHFFTRYLLTMQQLQAGLRQMVEAFGPRSASFAQGEVKAGELFGAGELYGRDAIPSWLSRAGSATSELIDLAGTWDDFEGFPPDLPKPQPVHRLTPDI